MRGPRRRFRTVLLYAAREFLFGFLVCFLFFFAVFFVNQILLMAEEILSKKAPLRDVLLLLLYSLPSVVAMSFPFASLVGALMAAGRMSSDNEFLAMMAGGIAPKRAFLPFVVLGLAFSLVSFSMNDFFLPLGTMRFAKLYRKLLASTPALELKPWSVKKYRDVTVVTGDTSGSELGGLLIFDKGDGDAERVISAARASLEASEDGVLLRLQDVWEQSVERDEPDRFEWAQASSMEYRLREGEPGEISSSVGPHDMASVDLARVIGEKEAAFAVRSERKREDAAKARERLAEAYELEAAALRAWANAAERLGPKLSSLRPLELPPPADRTLQVYKLEYYKKFSIPFGALCFVFLAFPLGLRARRAGRAVGFGLGLLVSVLYWALLLGGQTLGTRLGWPPFWAMWAPNLTVMASAALLWAARAARG
ncbi:MAG TPA: LptF/LptG family permease [Spirochaetales bacterium]|nr:LptF/LptG family permease [Spirochaetales bacterium]HRY55169.1 LptF/LptG family permease [Spirochaetia bacterium]HRZ65765.1 LptF/LptG family permease [Spirochaetia bacterium]